MVGLIKSTIMEDMFTRLFEQAEIAKFNPEELRSYEDSMNAYRDIVNAIKSAEKKKYAEGRAEVAKKLLAMGLPLQSIVEAMGLSADEIQSLC